MEPTRELIEQLEREDVERARAMSISQKLALGGDLFDAACEVTLSGIRAQYSGISRPEALEILRRRLEFSRRTETRI
jgi:hypothetical protein